MSGFYFALLAVILAGLGARDQVTIAGLSLRQGQRPGILIVGLFVSAATAALAAWGAALVAPLLAPPARLFMAAAALGLAGGESLLFAPRGKPDEPTHSLGALAIVLLAYQITDAARFLVFAIAVATNAPMPAGLAGAVGGAVLLGAAWAVPEVAGHPRVRLIRRCLGVGMFLLAIWIGLSATGTQ